MEEDKDMKSLLNDGYVFFNHFARVSNKNVDDFLLRQAWSRGAAFFAQQNTRYYDFLIPVAIPKSNAMSCIVVQVKNRQSDSLPSARLREEARDGMKHALVDISAHLSLKACLGIFIALRSQKKPAVEVVTPVNPPKPGPSLRSGAQTIGRTSKFNSVRQTLGLGRASKGPGQEDLVSVGTPGPLAAAAETPNPSLNWEQPKRLVILSAGLDKDLFPNLDCGSRYAEDAEIYKRLNDLVHLQAGSDLENDAYARSFIVGNKPE
jgi:hypothetical protein